MSDLNKPRHLSLPLDYFQGQSGVQRWKRKLGWGVLAVSLGGLLLHFLGNQEVHFGASPGPLASPHQVWDYTCSACHDPFHATSTHSWTPPGMVHATNHSCQTCHKGPPHHSEQKPNLNCASCHREHNGRDFSLVKIDDAHCTQCHLNLPEHSSGEVLPEFANVSHFSKDRHPRFRSVQSDPGKILFNHDLHMTPGMALRGEGGLEGAVFKLKNIPPEYRKRYAGSETNPEAAVILSCRSCHQMESGDFKLDIQQKIDLGPAAVAPPSAGAYFLPVTYENQCKACHPLQIEDGTPGKQAKALAIPHRMQPAELDRWLADYFTAQAARGLIGFDKMTATRPLPGKKLVNIEEPGVKKIGSVEDPDVKKRIEGLRVSAARALYREPLKKNCRLCHTPETTKGVTISDWGEEIPTEHWHIAASAVPRVWLKHAHFDHMAHRAVDCRECHANAYAMLEDDTWNKTASRHNKDVLIPDVDNCIQCHAPAKSSVVDGKVNLTGGVRFDCVLCHSYHLGDLPRDQPRRGRGAEARGSGKARHIQDVLKGLR